jgi:hypothetical protein
VYRSKSLNDEYALGETTYLAYERWYSTKMEQEQISPALVDDNGPN